MTVLPFGQPHDKKPHPTVLASDQLNEALNVSDEDYSDCPRWRWDDVYDLTGPMLPGSLTVLGALTGNGKTAFLLSQLDYLAKEGFAVLYAPLELDPEQMRRQWAAWRLGYPWEQVARNAWNELEPDAKKKHGTEMRRQLAQWVHFAPERRLSLMGLQDWVGWACEHIKAQDGSQRVGAVIVDHFHRMDHGGGNAFRVQVTDAARAMKDLARQYAVPVIAAAQLNRSAAHPVLDRYMPPRLDRLKESSALGEEADIVLMLSRSLRRDVEAADLKLVQMGHKTERDFEEPNVMQVTCRKHRLADAARDRTAKLFVDRGRVLDWRA